MSRSPRKRFKTPQKRSPVPSQKPKKTSHEDRGTAVTGIIRVHPRGFGFAIPDSPMDYPEIFIPKHLTDNAVDGDRVEILVSPKSSWEKGPEGRVIAILKRSRSHLAGTVIDTAADGALLAYSPILGTARQIILNPLPDDPPLRRGDRIIMRVLSWGNQQEATVCEKSHYIGHIDDASCDIRAAIEEFDLHDQFPQIALDEAAQFPSKPTPKQLKEREDLSDLETFTIDPETARDYDDALSLSQDQRGAFHLGVHIADAAFYVKAGLALDKEAFKRCNSTYFPGAVVPMLPERLSNDLCSLREGVIRLTVTVFMDFDSQGNLTHTKICRSYILSRKRFTYPEALDVLEGRKKSPHETTLKLMVKLCNLLKTRRSNRGSLDFSLPDLVIEVDKAGNPTGVRFVEYDITHQLVEEFMLKANEEVAKHLSKEGRSPLYRIHEEPSEENIEEFYALARSLGFILPKKPEQRDLQQLFLEAKSTIHGQRLAIGFIRSMKLAYYSPDNVGHFGLALEHYCHFTSPIRRYSDLITQRLLFNEEGVINLNAIALRCSEQERISFRAETGVKLLKKLRLLKSYLQKDPVKSYPATIVRVKPFGVSFEIHELMLEGYLHISNLDNDYFIYQEVQGALVGRHTGKIYQIGQEIQVRVLSVNLIFLESEWELVTSQPRKEMGKKKRRKRT